MGVAVKRITRAQLHELGTSALGLDSAALDLSSIEAVAGSLRRAASFLCPCEPRSLTDAVVQAVDPVVGAASNIRELVQDTLAAMVAYGDLIEAREGLDLRGYRRTLLYTAPPTFVLRRDGTAFLIGITPDQTTPLPEAFAGLAEHSRHVRRLRVDSREELRSQLKQYGLVELPLEKWLDIPESIGPSDYVARFDKALSTASSPGEVAGLTIVDSSKPVRYFPRRWVEPRSHTGNFVARRRQRYGSDLWCYVELRSGSVLKLLDLPLDEGRWRACDEAWRLQAAIDAIKISPQQFAVTVGTVKHVKVLRLFSPIPLWMQRRLDYAGEPVLASGCLLAYAIPELSIREEIDALKEKLWMQEV